MPVFPAHVLAHGQHVSETPSATERFWLAVMLNLWNKWHERLHKQDDECRKILFETFIDGECYHTTHLVN